ncbi:ATP-binding protein (plasmid) [Deinococcus taeanensis]|uniref:AAA-like domain-containing protein n=1 Tax=Deinococcus taeanensis TaxID=2737050 RepID=UPI001CDB8F94|nr:ATP-binding protein [Deinococcus taeanensis]UBV45545.1 ATP-binding protein [Deinococcus taeanensis]
MAAKVLYGGNMGEINPSLRSGILNGQQDLRNLLEPFTKLFNIKSGFRYSKSTSQGIYYFFLKPDIHGEKVLGSSSEILLIVTRDSHFRKSLLGLADNLCLNNQDLDNLLLFVTGVGNKFEDSAIESSNDPRSTRIIVPFLNDDLKFDKMSEELTNTIRRAAINSDLFDIRQPLQSDEMFFGRMAIINEIRAKIRQSENIGIFGLRRTGKTSVLLKMSRLMKSNKFKMISINAENQAVYSLRWWQLLQHIAEQMLPKDEQIGNDYTEASGGKRFSSLTNKLDKTVTYVIAIDEIEHISPVNEKNPHWKEDFIDFWKTIRAIHTTNRNIVFILSGVNGYVAEKSTFEGSENPLFNWIIPQYMPGLEIDELGKMVNSLGRYMGLQFDRDAVEHLKRYYGGHPMLVRLACSTVHKSLGQAYAIPTKITKATFEKNTEEINKILSSFYRQILDQICRWYPEEYEMLGMLANQDRQSFISLSEEFPEFSNHLHWYGLVDSDKNITIPSMIPEIKRHIRNSKKKESAVKNEQPKELTVEWKRSEIGRIRNGCEDRLKKLIKRGLKFKYGVSKWGASLVSHSVSYDKAKLHGINPDEILKSRLYLKDIKSILDKEWGAFQAMQSDRKDAAIQKIELLAFIDQLDQNRIDAHAGDIDDMKFGLIVLMGDKVIRTLDNLLDD